MKALIISDDKSVTSPIDLFLKKNNYDTIIYRWLVKALDNIEEIQPDLIILNAAEYPRHWKTLVQFVSSGLGGNDVKIFLYEPSPLSSEEEKKYAVLGITGSFSDLSDDSLSVIFDKKSVSGEIMLTGPDGKISWGIVSDFSDKEITCFMNDTELCKDDFIETVSLSINDEFKSCSAIVSESNNGTVTLSVNEYYEEI